MGSGKLIYGVHCNKRLTYLNLELLVWWITKQSILMFRHYVL